MQIVVVDSVTTTSDIAKTSSDIAITSTTANPEAKNSAVKEISVCNLCVVMVNILRHCVLFKTSESNDEDVKNRQPLVLKSAVLKLIAELIRSYSAVAGYVAEYRYTPPSGDLITEVRLLVSIVRCLVVILNHLLFSHCLGMYRVIFLFG